MDMETDEDEEDGQITKFEEQEERERRLYGDKSAPEDEPATLDDLSRIRLTRDMVARFCTRSWFEDFMIGRLIDLVLICNSFSASGAWVRYLIGNDENANPIYRVCEIAGMFLCLYSIRLTLNHPSRFQRLAQQPTVQSQ